MPPKKLPPHVRAVTNRAGQTYYYLQRGRGTKKAESRSGCQTSTIRHSGPSTLGTWICLPSCRVLIPSPASLMHGKRAHNGLKPPRQREWGRHCRNIREAWGDVAVTAIEPKHVLILQDAWAEKPASANNMIRCLSSLMSWSVSRGWRSTNPCREIKLLNRGDGYEPWPWNVIEVASAELRPDL